MAEKYVNFNIRTRLSDVPFVERIWRSRVESTGTFISQAASHWEIVFTRYRGSTATTIRGPETKARPLAVRSVGAEFLGITFRPCAFIPNFPLMTLLNGNDIDLQTQNQESFWLDGSTWEIPNFENADTFVKKLLSQGLLARDALVEAILDGHSPDISPRAMQYHFLQATGLTKKSIEQIQRAHRAAALLKMGTSILDTVQKVGYFDQSHLTNSLKRFLGQTPSQIMSEDTAY